MSFAALGQNNKRSARRVAERGEIQLRASFAKEANARKLAAQLKCGPAPTLHLPPASGGENTLAKCFNKDVRSTLP